jgi:phospholipid/cholesterol/gamma-HCH transport system substrate-binding protein
MSESPNRRPVIVGLFVLLGLVFLLAGVLTVGNLRNTFTKKMKVFSFFEDVSGLQAGSNIWFSGVKVGTVKKVRFDRNAHVEVTMSVDENARQYIRKDAKVKISTDGLIGNKILVIYGGSSKAEPVEEGDVLGVEKMLSTEDMMNTLQDNNKNLLAITNDFKLISNQIAKGNGTVGKLIADETLYNNMNATALNLNQASQQTELLIASLSAYSAKMNKEGTLANDLVTDTLVFNSIQASAEQLQRVADTTSLFVTNLKKAASNPNTPVGAMLNDEKTGKSLKATIRNLETSSAKLDRNLEGLQHSFLLRRYFKKEEKKAADSTSEK